jgi:uncharacterized membrane protein
MGITSDTYRIVLILHVVAVVAAFGPLFVYPTLHRAGATGAVARLHLRVALPAMFLVWVLGMGLAGLSDDVWKVSEPWLAASVVSWVVLMAVSWFLVRPALSDRSEPARARLSAGVGITHLLLVVTLWLMVFKPGA